ncbi:MAG: prepilin-type N-terminal cleavage/methylation domain-containing protein [Candidatus Omnitrophota bacterium]
MSGRDRTLKLKIMNKKGLTLIELLIAISIAVIIAVALYFTLKTALESWGFTKNQLALQKVLNQTFEEITSGTFTNFGLKDSLEVLTAGESYVEFVPPWTDDTHTVTAPGSLYTLNTKIKSGAAVPISEIKNEESGVAEFVSVTLTKEEGSGASKVALNQACPPGRPLFFTYHPDAKKAANVIEKIWWDSKEKQIYSEYNGESFEISKNTFDVKISKMELRYYDKTNTLITESEWVDSKDLILITGIEFFVEAELGQYKNSFISFVCLRNAPMRSGNIPLSEGLKVPIPDSYTIHSLSLRDISEISNEDVVKLKVIPETGKDWRIKLVFSKIGAEKPKIDRYTIEYPIGYEVYTEYPRMSAAAGIDLLMLGPNGRYDYDFDGADADDVVALKGNVTLEVERMDVEGARLFIRP